MSPWTLCITSILVFLPLTAIGGWFSPTCSDLTSNLVRPPAVRDDFGSQPENVQDVVMSLTTIDGRTFPRLTAPYRFNLLKVTYAESTTRRCEFGAMFIRQVVRKTPDSWEVTLTNNKTFIATPYTVSNVSWMAGFTWSPFDGTTSQNYILDKDNNLAPINTFNWVKELQSARFSLEPASDLDKSSWEDARQLIKKEAERLAENAKIEKAKKAAYEAQLAEAAQARAKKDFENKLAQMPIVKTVGQKICRTAMSTWKTPTGYAVLGVPQYSEEVRTTEISGITEKSSGDRVLVRVGRIVSTGLRGDIRYEKELGGEVTYQVNQSTWDQAWPWAPCN